MTNYEVFKKATPESMAVLLTSMAASLAKVKDPKDIRVIYNTYLELLGRETELSFLVGGEAKDAKDDVVLGHFAQRLKAARMTKGLTQQGMADRLMLPIRTLIYWEREERTPPEYIQRLVLRELESWR